MAECVRPKKPKASSRNGGSGNDVTGNDDVTSRYDVESSGHADKLNNAVPTVDDSYDGINTGGGGNGYDDKEVPSYGVTNANDDVTNDGGDVSISSQYPSSSASSMNADSSSLQSDVTTDYPQRLVVALPEIENHNRDVVIADRDVAIADRDVTVAPHDVRHPEPSAPVLDPGDPPGYSTEQYDAVIFYNNHDYRIAASFQNEIERVCRARGYDPSIALFHEDLGLGQHFTQGATNFMQRSNFWFFLISDYFVGDRFMSAVHDDAIWEQWDKEECKRSRVPVYTKEDLKGRLPFVRGVKSIEFLDMKLERFAEKNIIKAFQEDERKKADRQAIVERDRRIWRQDKRAAMLAAATQSRQQEELANRNVDNTAVRPAPAIEPLRLPIPEPTRLDSMNSVAATVNSSMNRLSLDSQFSSDVSQDLSRLDSIETPEPIDATSTVAVTSNGRRPMDLRSNPGGAVEVSPTGSPARGEESPSGAQGAPEEEGALEEDGAQTEAPAGPMRIPSVATDASGNAQINLEPDDNDDLRLVDHHNLIND